MDEAARPVETPSEPGAGLAAPTRDDLDEAVDLGRSVPLADGVVRALAQGAAPGAVIEQAANAIRVLAPDRGVAVWYRRADETATVQAAGIGAHLVMITGDPDSPFWERARNEVEPNYRITFQAHTEDTGPTSIWCVPVSEGPSSGELTVAVVGRGDGTPPELDVRVGIEHLTRLIAVAVDRQRLVARLEVAQERSDRSGPEVQTGLTPTRGSAQEPEGTVLFYVRAGEIDDIAHVHGHKAAETVTNEVGRRLSRTIRPGDAVARLSSADFALRCHGVTAIQAESIASRVLNELWQPVVTRWEETRLKPRVGLARATSPTPLEQLVKHADLAMRQADEAGRDWLWFGDDTDPQPSALGPASSGSGFGAGCGPQPPAEEAETESATDDPAETDPTD